MVWFYTRDRDALRLEMRYANQTKEYVGILTYPDGRREEHRFPALRAYRAWLQALDTWLDVERWTQDGAPYLLADGWPDVTPSQ